MTDQSPMLVPQYLGAGQVAIITRPTMPPDIAGRIRAEQAWPGRLIQVHDTSTTICQRHAGDNCPVVQVLSTAEPCSHGPSQIVLDRPVMGDNEHTLANLGLAPCSQDAWDPYHCVTLVPGQTPHWSALPQNSLTLLGVTCEQPHPGLTWFREVSHGEAHELRDIDAMDAIRRTLARAEETHDTQVTGLGITLVVAFDLWRRGHLTLAALQAAAQADPELIIQLIIDGRTLPVRIYRGRSLSEFSIRDYTADNWPF